MQRLWRVLLNSLDMEEVSGLVVRLVDADEMIANYDKRLKRTMSNVAAEFGYRTSGFFRTSDFGFRIFNASPRRKSLRLAEAFLIFKVMPPEAIQHETVRIMGLSNREFLQKYARPGRVGLSGGFSLVDKAICRAQRHLDEQERWGEWSHAFVFQGVRPDGHHWIIESNLQVHHKHIQIGVQENRTSKYEDEKSYATLAVLDFGLNEEQVAALLREGLELVASHARYSLRELFGTMIALRHPTLRGRNNLLAQDRSMYCSAFVQHLFRKMGVELAPGVAGKNTTPQDVFRTSVPHVSYLLQRREPRTSLDELKLRVRKSVRTQIRGLRKAVKS